MTSDDKYIKKVISDYNNRKKRSVVFAIISIIFAIVTYAAYAGVEDKINNLVGMSSSALHEGLLVTENDIELVKVNSELSYSLGIQIGQMISSFSTLAGLSLGYSIYLMFGARKERIIVKLYEQTKI